MQVGVSCVRGQIPHNECRACALKPDHPCMLPPDLLEEVRLDPTDRHADPDAFSPTGLMDCDRKYVLKTEHDWYVDVDDIWPALRGTMVHALAESATYPETTVIRERTFEVPVITQYGTQRMTGKPDLIVVNSETDDEVHIKVVDYKSTTDIKHDFVQPKKDHVRQLNMYAWLLRRAFSTKKVIVDELELFYADMRKARRFTSATTLQTRGKMISRSPRTYETLTLEPIRIFPDDVVTRFIVNRIERKIEARQTLPPVLEGDDAWRCYYCELRAICTDLAERGV